MSLLEFDVIKNYFTKVSFSENQSEIPLGIGDDAAVVTVPNDMELVVCTDTLNEGVHFPIETSAYNVAYKALMVNLSDLAAMGAEPKWFTLNISLPNINEQWLEDFAKGLSDLATKYRLNLIGGDTTQGPLSISITLAGHIKKDTALTRANAKVGDNVYLSGCTGEAAYGLACIMRSRIIDNADTRFVTRLNRPTARVELGLGLIGIANACIDISDGLLADVTHIAEASSCGIELNLETIPLPNTADVEQAQKFALTGGDDYELVFTAPAKNQKILDNLIKELDVNITCIGIIIEKQGVHLLDENNNYMSIDKLGYQHFS